LKKQRSGGTRISVKRFRNADTELGTGRMVRWKNKGQVQKTRKYMIKYKNKLGYNEERTTIKQKSFLMTSNY
jgi:hypothetical protein